MNNIEKYQNFLKSHYPFNDMPEDMLAEIASTIQAHQYGVGRTIYKKGDKGEIFYIIHTGSVYETITNTEGEEIVVSTLHQGDCFGAISLLTDETHLVTTKIREDAEIYTIDKPALESLIEKHPALNRYLNRILKNKINHFFTFFETEKIKVVDEIKDAGEKEKELSILTKVTELMNSEHPDTVLKSITSEMRKVMDAESCSVFLLDPLSSELILEASSGIGETSIKSAAINLDEGITGWVVRNGEPATIEDMHADPRVKFISDIGEEKLSSLLSVPLIERGNVIGAINICTVEKRKFSYQEVRGAVILANHIALAVSNSRLRRKVEAIVTGKGGKKRRGDERFIGETSSVRKLNSFIEAASKHDDSILITGEEGTGKTLMAKLIHKKGRRHNGPFIVVDCRTFEEESWGSELFGFKEKHGFLELTDGGTIFLRNVDGLNKVNQVKLSNFLRDGTFNRVDGKDTLKSNIRVISAVSHDLAKEVREEQFNKNTYESLARISFDMKPLRKRRKDIPLIANHIVENLNWELHKKVKKISNLAMERLLSYDWPGNILELENVLRRTIILTKDDKILSEQIFFGLPRVEKKWEFNLLSVKKIKNILLNRLYPVRLQGINIVLFGIFLLILFLGPVEGTKNPASLILWSAGWFFMYILLMLFGRIWCGMCPFSLLGDFAKSIKGFELSLPKWIVNYGNIILTCLILFFFWVEGVTAITHAPRYTAYLLLSIPLGAILFSILFERHVWCRYFCPLGGLMGVYSIFSFLTLKANRKICLSQCQTHECYLGGRESGCPTFLHPYGLENNQHCVLCMHCLKNCGHDSIHLPFRVPFSQVPSMEPSAYIFSFLSLALCGIIMVENGSLLAIGSTAFNTLAAVTNIHEKLLYTSLFFAAAAFPIAAFYIFNLLFNKSSLETTSRRIKTFGYAFIPLSLTGHIAFYFKRLLIEGRGFGKGVEAIYDLFHVGEYRLGPGLLLELVIILGGAAGSLYIIAQMEKRFIKKYEYKQSSLKGEAALLGVLWVIYTAIICL